MTKAHNIFVSYDLFNPERGDERIQQTIEAFGCVWARISRTVFYLHGEVDANLVGTKIWAAMNMDDRLVVIDTTKNDARWYNIKPEVSEFMVKNWHA
jgi:hypothetical protein